MFKKISFHITFWLISLNICAFIFGYQNNWEGVYLLTAIYAPIPICSAYFIDGVLVKKYLLTGRVWRFVIYMIYLIIVSLLLLMILNTLVLINLADLQYELLPNATKDIVVLFSNLYLLVFLFVSTQSTRKYTEIQKEQEKNLKKIAQTELKLLRSQLNPHFLFNTLNNLYSLALKRSDITAEAILKLSNLLDKVLNSNKNELVSLEDELKVVEDYIYLESLRYNDALYINKQLNIADAEKIFVPPMCLLLLIENCFKHGAKLNTVEGEIFFEIEESADLIYITTSNKIAEKPIANSKSIGLENLKLQLEHIYGEKSSIKTSSKDGQFTVNLTIPK